MGGKSSKVVATDREEEEEPEPTYNVKRNWSTGSTSCSSVRRDSITSLFSVASIDRFDTSENEVDAMLSLYNTEDIDRYSGRNLTEVEGGCLIGVIKELQMCLRSHREAARQAIDGKEFLISSLMDRLEGNEKSESKDIEDNLPDNAVQWKRKKSKKLLKSIPVLVPSQSTVRVSDPERISNITSTSHVSEILQNSVSTEGDEALEDEKKDTVTTIAETTLSGSSPIPGLSRKKSSEFQKFFDDEISTEQFMNKLESYFPGFVLEGIKSLSKRGKAYNLLLKASNNISKTKDLKSAQASILSETVRLLHCEEAQLYIVSGDGSKLVNEDTGVEIDIRNGVMGEVARLRKAMNIHCMAEDKKFEKFRFSVDGSAEIEKQDREIKSILSQPVFGNQRRVDRDFANNQQTKCSLLL